MLRSLPSEYKALIVYVGFILLIFMGALLWNKYRTYLKKKYPLINYHEDHEDADKLTHHA